MKTLLVSLLLGLAFQGLRVQSQDLEAVHEWGTFTTFSGSDGTPIGWWSQALEGPAVLPEFVVPIGMKGGSPFVTRMETPVLYFYAKQPTEVKVRVDYRQGLLTEIFPPGRHEMPQQYNAQQPSSAYSWTVDLLPPDSAVGDTIPPVGKRGSHYQQAREVPDAWIVQSKPLTGEAQPAKVAAEKFIFYRGAGAGTFPLQSSLKEDGSLTVNTYSAITTEAFLVRVRDGVTHWQRAQIATKPTTDGSTQSFTVAAPDDSSSAEGLAAALRQALTTAGLTTAEAAAMVATWHEAWLGEEGTRLLYLIPEPWINERLPLQITPAPKEMKRVFVARDELFPPQQEQTLVDTLTGIHTDAERAKMIASLRLGRFVHPAVERALKINEQKLRNAFYGAMLKQ